MIFASPAQHHENPPATWTVRKHGRKWGLFCNVSENPLDTFLTKREAEAGKVTGFIANLYAKETRWYTGERVDNWKVYAQCVAERQARNA